MRDSVDLTPPQRTPVMRRPATGQQSVFGGPAVAFEGGAEQSWPSDPFSAFEGGAEQSWPSDPFSAFE